METRTGSYLPVEIPEGNFSIPDQEFDGKENQSHLKNCPQLAAEWEQKKKKFVERNNPFNLSIKELSR